MMLNTGGLSLCLDGNCMCSLSVVGACELAAAMSRQEKNQPTVSTFLGIVRNDFSEVSASWVKWLFDEEEMIFGSNHHP